MRISVLCLLTGMVMCCALSCCNQKQQSTAVTPAAENKTAVADTIVLPVTVIITDDATEGRQLYADHYPKTWTLNAFDTTATPIAVYGASDRLWLGPKGYVGSGATGADGSVVVRLYPPGGSDTSAPFVNYEAIPACQGCMMIAAAPYFETAKTDLLKNYDSTFLDLVHIPSNLVIQKRSATLVTYTYQYPNRMQVTGVACYTSENNIGRNFQQAQFALGPNNKALTDVLVKQYISMWGFK